MKDMHLEVPNLDEGRSVQVQYQNFNSCSLHRMIFSRSNYRVSDYMLEYVTRGPKVKTYPNSKCRRMYKKGVMVALVIGDEVALGWSLCHHRLDDFDKYIGVAIACDRALKYFNSSRVMIVPHSLIDRFVDFRRRVELYYKDKTIATRFIMGKKRQPKKWVKVEMQELEELRRLIYDYVYDDLRQEGRY